MQRPSFCLIGAVLLAALLQPLLTAATTDNLMSYWSLGEASGNALDAHGSLPLTETSGTITSAAGKVGNARDFEVTDTEWFETADAASLSPGDTDFTICVWVNFESFGAFRFIIGKDDTTTNREYSMYFNPAASGTLNFAVSANGTANVIASATNFGAPSLATWYHVCGWHDSVLNQVAIAVNAGTPNTTSHTTGVRDGTASFQIGAENSTLSFDGLIDEVGFWKRVLTSTERTWLYNGGTGRSYTEIVTGMPAIRHGLLTRGVGP